MSGRGRTGIAALVGAGVIALAVGAAARDLHRVVRTWSEMGPLGAGHEIPPFRAALVGGATLDNEALAGEVTLLAFWASWCGVCERQMPTLQALHRAQAPRGLRVIGVNTDRTGDQASLVERYRAAHGIDFAMALDNGPVARAFRVSLLPHVALIDRAGRLRHVHPGLVGERELSEEALALLAE